MLLYLLLAIFNLASLYFIIAIFSYDEIVGYLISGGTKSTDPRALAYLLFCNLSFESLLPVFYTDGKFF